MSRPPFLDRYGFRLEGHELQTALARVASDMRREAYAMHFASHKTPEEERTAYLCSSLASAARVERGDVEPNTYLRECVDKALAGKREHPPYMDVLFPPYVNPWKQAPDKPPSASPYYGDYERHYIHCLSQVLNVTENTAEKFRFYFIIFYTIGSLLGGLISAIFVIWSFIYLSRI